eukprot:9928829-Ditylum_brightwellii.AAC.1
MKARGVTRMILGYAVNHSDGQHHPPAELTVNDDCLDNKDRESDGNVVSSAAKPDAGEMLGTDDGVDVGDGVAEGVEEGPNKETI